MRLTDAEGADAPAMTRLFLEARRDAMPWLPELYGEPDVLNWMAQVVAQTRVVLAVSPEGVAGFASWRPRELAHLYVAPGRQGRGVGAALLAAVKAESPQGLRLFVFLRNARARAFYERRGFVLRQTRDGSHNEENEPDALYEWRP